MAITGTHHIAIKCTDENKYEETIRFYRDVLGMKMIRTWGEGKKSGCMLDTGNNRMEIFACGAALDSTGSVNHFALADDNVDDTVAAVKAAGYRITVEPHDIVIGSIPPYPARIAFCIGPNGEEIELFCEK